MPRWHTRPITSSPSARTARSLSTQLKSMLLSAIQFPSFSNQGYVLFISERRLIIRTTRSRNLRSMSRVFPIMVIALEIPSDRQVSGPDFSMLRLRRQQAPPKLPRPQTADTHTPRATRGNVKTKFLNSPSLSIIHLHCGSIVHRQSTARQEWCSRLMSMLL